MIDLEKYGFTKDQVTDILTMIEQEFPQDQDEDTEPEDDEAWDQGEPFREWNYIPSSFNWHTEPDSHGRV